MAADLTQNFWGKHFEKIILAVAAAIFVAAAVWFVFGRTLGFSHRDTLRDDVEKTVDNLTQPKNTPAMLLAGTGRNLDEELKALGLTDEQQKKVMDLSALSADDLKRLGLPDEKVRDVLLLKVMPAAEQAKLGLNQPPVTVKEFADQLSGLPPEWKADHDWTEKYVAPIATTEVEPVFQAPHVVSVTNLQVVTGRGTTDEPVPSFIFHLDKYSDIVWAGITGIVDLTDEQDAFKVALAGRPEAYQPIMISRVELQRRELKPDGQWSDWKPVVPAVTSTAATKWPKTPTTPRDTREVMKWGADVASMQTLIRHMPLYHLVAVDEEGRLVEAAAGPSTGTEQPAPAPPKPVEPVGAAPAPASAVAAAPAAGGPAGPWGNPGTPAKGGQPGTGPIVPPPPRESAKHVTTTVWAYDCTVEPGKTYQYQMRIGIRSPIYNLDLADQAVRWMPEFGGEWSTPSRDVTLPPTVQFYFVGTYGGGTFGEKANIEVQRWILGQWVHVPSVPTSPGAPIVVTPPARKKLLLPGGGNKFTPDNVEVDMNPAGIILVDVLRSFLYQPEGGGMKATRTNVLIFADPRGQLQQRIEYEDKTAAATAWKAREGAGGGPATTPTTPAVPIKTLPPAKTPLVPKTLPK
jgi:hypothetical protein